MLVSICFIPPLKIFIFLKSLGKMLFKNSLRDTLGLIWSIWPLPSVYSVQYTEYSLHNVQCSCVMS